MANEKVKGVFRQYKSGVFTMLLEEKERALEVFNALNGSEYTDPNKVEIVKLKQGILLSVRNDASFVLDSTINFYEHQSTYNPNMPLRSLIYYCTELQQTLEVGKQNLFGTKQIKVPTPHFVVFYNGKAERPEREIMRLSSAYERSTDTPELELVCSVYNINPGSNRDFMAKTTTLREYMIFVEKVRALHNEDYSMENALDTAINECIEEGILSDFFKRRKNEVMEVAILDFTYEKQLELEILAAREDAREEGLEEGLEEGRKKGRKEGRAEGREEGRAEAIKEMAERMYEQKISIDRISEITHLSLQEVDEIINSKHNG